MTYTATDINKRVRIGADVGGTFTDVILVDATDKVWTHKVPSTPPDFERAILHAIEHLLERSWTEAVQIDEIAHGTTVATNAVLERQGAHTALVTTAGFRDVLELRRIRAPQIYNLFWDKPPQLVDRGLRFELSERIASDGKELIGVDLRQLHEIGKQLQDEKIESLAVCLLHAYAYPEHEQVVGDFLRRKFPGLPISLSHEILPERKEYERTATTVVNAYVRPVMRRYLNALRQGLENLGSKATTGIATFVYFPNQFGNYISKINCFCYDAKTLKPKQKGKYTLVLLIDPEATKDSKTKNIKEVTIQFTFFDYKEYKKQKS